MTIKVFIDWDEREIISEIEYKEKIRQETEKIMADKVSEGLSLSAPSQKLLISFLFFLSLLGKPCHKDRVFLILLAGARTDLARRIFHYTTSSQICQQAIYTNFFNIIFPNLCKMLKM